MWDCHWAGKRCSRIPSFYKNIKLMVLDDSMWVADFSTPSCNMSLHSKYKWSTHLDSSVVWAQWDILMGGWPWWVNTANIDSSHPPGCVFLSADLTRCWPKHLTAWLLRLDMAAQVVWLNIWHIFGMSQFISCDETIIWSANSQKSVTCIYSQPNELFTTVVDRQTW